MDVSTANITWRVLVVFSLAFFGVIARKFGFIKEEARDSFADTMLNITLPSLIFVSITAEVNWGQLLAGIFTPLLSFLLILTLLAMATILVKLIPMPSNRVRTFLVLCTMPNTGFIGFPVILSVLGKAGLAYAVLYDMGVTIAFCSIAMFMIKGGPIKGSSWKTLINPSLVAVICGLLFNEFGVRIPDLVLAPLRIMGDSTIPLAMLLMGYTLGGLKFQLKSVTLELGMVCLVKLVLYPLLAYAVMLLLPFHISPLLQMVIIIEAAMPSMASTMVLVQKYGGDNEFAATGIFVTTLLSIVTIPLMLHFLGF